MLTQTETQYDANGNPSTAAADSEKYTYNALGEVTTRTDRNGSVHAYSYDVLGRLTADAVTTLASGVDGAIRRIETAYDTAGRPFRFTSYDAPSGGNVVNQVERVYNGLGQLITEYQAHAGAVDPATTPKVQYGYSEMAGGANHSRLTSLTYPNGRVLNYNYSAGLDDRISRLSSLFDNSATLESYDYLGLATVVRRAHPQPSVDLTYIKQAGEADGDAGDPYTGLDRFGRVVDQRWRKGDGSHTDRFAYGYDRNNNRLYRQNLIDAAFSELYHANGASEGYDLLNQLTAFRRGVLSDSNSDGIPDTVASASRSQEWDFDALGNWSTLTTDGTPESRSHNRQNQITAISGQTTPAYDNNGNLTTDPTGKTLVYDAWNRLVKVKDGATTLVTYSHDALSRRVTEDRSGTVTDLYYSAAWQVLEERVGGTAKIQYVWSPVYVDALVLRDRDANGQSGDGLEERLYVQQDANWNVTALVDAAGNLVERYVYDPYGNVTVLTPTWGPRGGSLYGWVYFHQGGRYEAVSALYHFRYRELSVSLGRWEKIDPEGYAAGDNNLYRHEGNRPTNQLDPSGLDVKTWEGKLNLPKPRLDRYMEYKVSLEYSCEGGTPRVMDAKVEYSNLWGSFDNYGFALGVGYWTSHYVDTTTKWEPRACPEGKKGFIADVEVTISWMQSRSWTVGGGVGIFGVSWFVGDPTIWEIAKTTKYFTVDCCC